MDSETTARRSYRASDFGRAVCGQRRTEWKQPPFIWRSRWEPRSGPVGDGSSNAKRDPFQGRVVVCIKMEF